MTTLREGTREYLAELVKSTIASGEVGPEKGAELIMRVHDEMVAAAVAAERERCALLADAVASSVKPGVYHGRAAAQADQLILTAAHIARMIRGDQSGAKTGGDL